MRNKFIKFFFVWMMFFGTLALAKLYLFPTGFASAQTTMSVQVNSYWSYTKAFDSKCDYYIECNGTNLINITKLNCYVSEIDYKDWCFS